MADTINVAITEEIINLEMAAGVSWNQIAGKPTPASENSFMISNSALAWVVKTLAQIKTILGLALPPQSVVFANPLALDATTYKDFKCASVTGDTTVNLTGESDGDAGMIELIIDGTGGYTVALGAMFTKNAGGGTIDTTASTDNIIAWTKSGSDIIYSINQVE